MKIREIKAREILDSRGNPTVECEVVLENGKKGWASVPSGASTGEFEAHELRDGDSNRFGGKGVLKAVENIEKKIAIEIVGMDVTQQSEIDQKMIDLDGTGNKSDLGANAILAVSMAVARAAAVASKIPLYKYIEKISNTEKNKTFVRPYFNIINGGMHAGNKIAFQEFMISPDLGNFADNYKASAEIYQVLKRNLKKDFGGVATLLGDEGGFAPDDFEKAEDALDKILEAIDSAGHNGKVGIAMDVAASEFFKDGKYDLGFKMENSNLKSAEEMISYYLDLIEKYPMIKSIEDPFDQSDFKSFSKLLSEVENRGVQIVADDLTVTNPKRIQTAIDNKSANALLLKINQIGTITESVAAFNLAKSDGWKVMVSHRSGETTDDFIADFAVGIGAEQIKSGAAARGERIVKYNRLLTIFSLEK